MAEERAAQNTDRELWREAEGDYYAPSIHVTEQGGIGINVGGNVFVKPVRDWHRLTARVKELERAERACDALTAAMARWGWQHFTTEVELIEQIDSVLARAAKMELALQRLEGWLVCQAITTPEDMAQSFPDMLEIVESALAGKGEG